ncbi:MAG: cytochrome ubiquinol oxidase subunit I [Bacteroidota bacterium]|jgi:cytochrome d ubiquinol oxidase subunit I|nr:cytochrome ubiquinol oxidase subunit I [Ignavibacteria bacterium]MCU7498965.1 cytochrome ubiquinol oxidase subunit I [Ignavibacteria bacterium]MCU7512460.1 cytochrome ubiquinol oxidase subunit I [Ignavibacteria bacterium]MCU7518569.1 cytochrome ubiquinol oxidase subunit I [Ignavibacteria bacterium]MCU7524253.1 cytochrome ubiquinol oxidase subunit I [Ignavibacteria bacterium]
MDTALLARIQFAFTLAFHYIFPPMSIGLGLILVIMEGMYIKTKNKIYEEVTQFWVKIFSLMFAMGVATGIVMEFEFGTNWAAYSRYVGDVFGSALASEGIFAFFLESGFLAILVFGWDKVSPRVHFFSTIMVSLGSMMSAVWIIVANSWQQTPAGFHIVGHGLLARAEITDFWQMVFNPSTLQRLSHTLSGAWQAGAFLVISVSAFYLLKNKYTEFAKFSLKVGLALAVFASLFQLLTGHQSAAQVSSTQPAKLAAFEAHFDSLAPASMHLFGIVDEKNQQVKYGISIPGLLSFLVHGDPSKPVTGLNAFKKSDLPPVQFVFQTYHLMVAIGMTLILISLLSLFFLWKKKLYISKWWLRILVASVLLPQAANQLGWFSAEVGRQPWVVYGLLRTTDGLSKAVHSGQILFSLILFTFVYALLFILFIYLLDRKIKHGPAHPGEMKSEYDRQQEIFT